VHGNRRRLTQFHDAAQSLSRVERIIAGVDIGPQGINTRFIVTSLSGVRASMYKGLYCARGRQRTTSKAWETILPPTARPATEPKPTNSAVPAHRRLLVAVVDAPRHAKRSIWHVM
jgi:hypothetical protein